ncbi:hypothetical protein TorRG33x02_048410, partial [Trema orientale]
MGRFQVGYVIVSELKLKKFASNTIHDRGLRNITSSLMDNNSELHLMIQSLR